MPLEIPPAIHAPATQAAADRMITCIVELEQTPWSKPGGALGFIRSAWSEDSELPYRCASNPSYAIPVARARIARFIATCANVGLTATTDDIGDAWRHGFSHAIQRMRRGGKLRPNDYGMRFANLFNDPMFK